jgi:protocatechuate 4,5-dioxygenase beta chain
MNCIMPPVPDAASCLRLGRVLRETLDAFPGNERVAIMATGGLSHDPGGPNYFAVNEAWDRWFMGLMESGDQERMARELTFEKLLEGGDGGAAELLAWLVAAGAAGAPAAKSVFYVGSVPQRCGLGGMTWQAGARA